MAVIAGADGGLPRRVPVPGRAGPEDLARVVLSFYSLPPLEPLRRAQVARAAGFTSIGLSLSWLRRWLAAGHGLAELEDALAEGGVTVGELDVLRPLGGQPDEAEEVCWAVAERLRVPYVGVIGPYAGSWDDAVARFAGACDRAATVGTGVMLGVEFLPFTNIPDGATAASLVRAAGRANGGVCLDVWHVYRGGQTPDDLGDGVWPYVVRLQLSDGPLVAEDDDLLADCLANRRPLGDGEFDLTGLLAAAARRRPEVGMSIEVISERLRAEPPERIAPRLAAGLRALLRGHGRFSPASDVLTIDSI
ncbi:sugar phosphate isomerase/epimerase [Frankia sp. Cj3]|uniref:sugar phosphate isomerase/epimerase family protein n=1 Tax=Frankia sp. Cj3 TaxID=2880976 RepID=UPI001EF5F931|nr:sugar phosphate isomerase/epimerase [Frankia sp. Cj3]